MKKQHLFTINVDLVKQLHQHVPRGRRSQFVETAIRNKLKNEEEFKVQEISDRQLMAVLHSRLSQRNDASAEMMKVFLLEELK